MFRRPDVSPSSSSPRFVDRNAAGAGDRIARETIPLYPGHADLLDRLAMGIQRLETHAMQVRQIEELTERDEPRTRRKRAGIEECLRRPRPDGARPRFGVRPERDDVEHRAVATDAERDSRPGTPRKPNVLLR